MADTPNSFPRNDQLQSSRNFHELKNKGLEYIKQLSGEIWTDYNAHDPGITILEQLCFALTDLAYRTSFDVEELLTLSKGKPIEAENNAFYSPRTIFSRHPVTALDFRKLIIDRYKDVQNVWIYPLGNNDIEKSADGLSPINANLNKSQDREESISGLYEVVVMPSLEFQKQCQRNPQKKVDLILKVKNYIAASRNIGEDFPKIILLEPINDPKKSSQVLYPIDIEIHILENEDADFIMAEVLFSLEVFLYQPVPFSSLQELIQEGKSLEEIFSGPRLKSGFIKDENLTDRNKSIHVDQIHRLLSKIKGVERSKNIAIGLEKLKFLEVNNEKYLNLDLDNPTTGAFETIKLLFNGSRVQLNKIRVNRRLLELWSERIRFYNVSNFPEEYFNNKLKGNFRNPIQYHSIQHQFPLIYGIGKEGISKLEPSERKAAVKQLRAYLLFFEQHLANYLAQLANLNSLFSVKNTDEPITYFYQELKDVVKVDEVLDEFSNEDEARKILGYEDFEIFLDRKNRLFDHLLARFGERIDELPFLISLKVNLIPDMQAFKHELLQRKSAFLIALEDINYYQNKGEYLKRKQKLKDLSGLEQLIRIKTGIPEKEGKLVSEVIDREKDLNSSKNSSRSQIKKENFSTLYRNISEEEKSTLEISSDGDPDLSAIFGLVGLNWIMRNGCDYQNYMISKSINQKNLFEVIFEKDDKKWVRLFESDQEKECLRYINKLVSIFRTINTKSEGVYIVDHILLRSFLENSKYGFEILDQKKRKTFQSKWVDSSIKRKEFLDSFYQSAGDKKNYKKDDFTLRNSQNELLGNFFPEVKNSDQYLESFCQSDRELVRLMSGNQEEFGRLGLYEIEKIRLEGNLGKDGDFTQRRVILNRFIEGAKEEFGEDFFDQSVSIILPDWPARFQQESFKSYLHDLILERLPVHIEANVYWLGLKEFKEFEDLYLNWKEAKIQCSEDKQDLKEHSMGLARMLKILKSRKGEL